MNPKNLMMKKLSINEIKICLKALILLFLIPIGISQLVACESVKEWNNNDCVSKDELDTENVMKIKADTRLADNWGLRVSDIKGICNDDEASSINENLYLDEINSSIISIDSSGGLLTANLGSLNTFIPWKIGEPLVLPFDLDSEFNETQFPVNFMTLKIEAETETGLEGQAFFGQKTNLQNSSEDSMANEQKTVLMGEVLFFGKFELTRL